MSCCPFSSLGHDTSNCIVTQGKAGRAAGCCDTVPRRPAIQPGGLATQPAYARGERQRARAAWPLGVCHDKKFVL